MKKIFTFLVAFLATMSGAVWGQDYQVLTSGNAVSVEGDGAYYFTTNGQQIENGGIKVTDDSPTIHLKDVNIKAGGSAIIIENGANPTIIVEGENTIMSSSDPTPAIRVGNVYGSATNVSLTIEGTGILKIEMSEDNGIAIGNCQVGGAMGPCGSVTINSSTVQTNGRIGHFTGHAFRFGGNAIVIANDIEGFDHNDKDMRRGGLLFLNDDTPYVGEFHTPEQDPEFTLSSPLPEPYKIEVRSGGVEVTIGEGQSLEESQVDLQGGTLNAYKVSYESPKNLEFGVSLPTPKYHGPKYATESLTEAKATYQLGTYALLTTNLWETVASNSTWAEAGKKQDKKDVSTGITEVKYSLVGTLTEKELNLKTDEGLTTEFSLWYPTSLNITATEDANDDGNLSTYGMQMTKGIVQKSTPFTALTETTETQEVQINLSALPSVSAIDPAILKINVDDKVTDITDASIQILLNDPKWVYDGKEKTDLANLANLVTVQKKEGDEVITYTYNTHYTLEFSLDKNSWSPVTPKDANLTGYYVKVIGQNLLSETKILDTPVTIAKADLTIKVTTTPRVDVGTDLANAEFPASTFLTIETAVEGEDVNLVGNLTVKEGVSADTEKTIDDAFSYDNVELKADEETSSPFKESNYTVTWPDKISLIVGKITINPGGDGEGGEEGDDVIGGEEDGNGELDFILIHPDGEDQCSVYDGDPHGLDVLYVGEEQYKLVKGTDYTVSYKGFEEDAEPVNAGEYTATITLLDDSKYQLEGNSKEFTLALNIIERPVTVDFGDYPSSIDISTETLDASQYAIWQKAEEEGVPEDEGLVKGQTPICEGTLALVESEDYPGYFKVYLERETFKVKDNDPFFVSNYVIYVEDKDGNLIKLEDGEGEEGGATLPGDGDDPLIDDPDSDNPIRVDDGGNSGSGITTKRYQLYLANKDYNVKDAKEDYAAEGLELFSRHNKKYTNAGSSFTVWYEKDGVANAGGYRIFWSNRANGEYKEVKFDTVSEYFQIRNVQSNVYVKIYAADGFPVGNEEISAADYRAYAQPNKIVVITPQPTDVQIISMAGAVVATDKVTGQREFANLTEGVYIVRMGETVVKLQVRK